MVAKMLCLKMCVQDELQRSPCSEALFFAIHGNKRILLSFPSIITKLTAYVLGLWVTCDFATEDSSSELTQH